MVPIDSSLALSHLFDKKLIEIGDWTEDEQRNLNGWNESLDFNEEKIQAAQVVSNLIITALGDDCSSRGSFKIRRLSKVLHELEQILMSTKALDNKYYRDHLNHSVRVALLGKIIGSKKPFSLDSKEMNLLIISCLFHDIAYPISQVKKMMDSTNNALKYGYIITKDMDLNELNLKLDDSHLNSLFIDKKISIKDRLTEFDHGILSAMEFIYYLKNLKMSEDKYFEVVKAIAFHSYKKDENVDINVDKLLSVLILADEIQDWGRPNNFGTYNIFKIDPFIVVDNNIECVFDIFDYNKYSLLRQLYGKNKNLSRLNIGGKSEIKLIYPYKYTIQCEIALMSSIIKKLFDICLNYENVFEESKNVNLYRDGLEAEEIYYGINISRKSKEQLYKNLLENKLFDDDINKYKIILNPISNESVFIENKILQINKLILKNFNKKFKLIIDDGKNLHTGELFNINDVNCCDLANLLASQIRFFNICIQKLIKYRNIHYPYEYIIENFARQNEIDAIIHEFNLPKITLVYNLRDIINSIASDGIFLFK